MDQSTYLCSVRKVITFAMLGCLLAPAMLKMQAVVDYAVRYEYYVQVLCENRDQPELQCNGKCHLNKQLTAGNEAQEKPGTPATVSFELQLFCDDVPARPLQCFALPPDELNPYIGYFVSQHRPGVELPPPRA